MPDNTPAELLDTETMSMPDGNLLTKDQAKEMLIMGVADEFRRARNGAYSSGDWVREAAEKVVEKLFNLDAYFEHMLQLQAAIAKKAGVKRAIIKKILKENGHEEP